MMTEPEVQSLNNTNNPSTEEEKATKMETSLGGCIFDPSGCTFIDAVTSAYGGIYFTGVKIE